MTMRRIFLSAALLACNVAAFAQTATSCGTGFDAALRTGATLSIHAVSAGMEIIGTDRSTVHVSCFADDAETLRQLQVQVASTSEGTKLVVNDPPSKHGNVKIRIEIPRTVNLELKMTAGDVNVQNISGDMDLTLRAGAITVSYNASDYKDTEASVSIGDVSVPASGEDKGGFFRNFRRQNPEGRYRLRAHVTTGQIVLAGMSA